MGKVAEKGGLPMPRGCAEEKKLTNFMLGQPVIDRKLVQFLQNDRKVLRFLKRHLVPRADGMGYLGPTDFVVGEEITIYGRTYHLTGCDRFTRWFFEELGMQVADDEDMPKDMWQKVANTCLFQAREDSQ